MDRFLQDRLEEYLSGELAGKDLAEFEARLKRDAGSTDEIARLAESHALFDAIRLDASEPAVPGPGFYARVNQLIESEKETPFWAVFLQPFMLRRLAFAALMWMFMLGSAAVFTDNTTRTNTELADLILSSQPPANYHVRMGADIDQNRASMLAVMMTPGD
jgi:anti-sigma factor RsiW